MSNRSKEEQIYDRFVDTLLEVTKPDEDTGKPPVLEAATLNAVRQFLKDQNIGADPDTHSGLKALDERTTPKRKAPFSEPNEGDL